MAQLKQPLDYEAQIERLKTFHKLEITDHQEALEILQSINYYRLSGYGIGLNDVNRDEYLPGVSLKDLYDLYQFDSILKNNLFHVIEQIEIGLRTKISYCLAIKYQADGYYNCKNFSQKLNKNGYLVHKQIMDSFKKEWKRNRNLPFVRHHLDKYNNKFPIWVAVELFTFGNLSSLYSIMLSKDKKEVAKQYHCSPNDLGVWIQSLVEVRNICAHYGRLYNLPLSVKPPLPKDLQKYYQRLTKIFPVIIAIKLILQSNTQWDSFFNSLKELLKKYENVVRLSFIGFPTNWEDILSKKIENN
ncbi:Abortive infection bacteriophage resistance protein [Succinivibrio dextrinosolvens DSM 3072]|uniref:Abortive infection bacteriophage resistance protein n=1 Tax=Succinivibrio dextrinosolvens DSM 3072 TaxID=1123324 RepID=A0A1T4VYA5_9GAMM|nr:Abi family protein [Succinivibrio dextrinosolvens]SKA69879.1 Abortive infection bacteriophage resistance protein [Succinivibrio dextrinosolvens DSM 3072]